MPSPKAKAIRASLHTCWESRERASTRSSRITVFRRGNSHKRHKRGKGVSPLCPFCAFCGYFPSELHTAHSGEGQPQRYVDKEYPDDRGGANSLRKAFARDKTVANDEQSKNPDTYQVKTAYGGK